MELDARGVACSADQGLRRIAADDAQLCGRLPRLHGREDHIQEQADRVEVGPPVEAAHEKDLARVSWCSGVGKESCIHAVVDHIDSPRAKLPPDTRRVLGADGHDSGSLPECPLLESLELPPLMLD